MIGVGAAQTVEAARKMQAARPARVDQEKDAKRIAWVKDWKAKNIKGMWLKLGVKWALSEKRRKGRAR